MAFNWADPMGIGQVSGESGVDYRRRVQQQRQAGEGDKPWWISQYEWDRRKAQTALTNMPSASDWIATWNQKYQPMLQNMQNYLYDENGNYRGPQWTNPDYTQYNQNQQGMSDLAARIQAGYQGSDIDAARNQVAQMYGMTPEQYQQLQGYFNVQPGSDEALAQQQNIQNQANTLATANDEMYQKYMESIRSAQRSSMAAAGKQMETIFANRGGLGGFAQAYEMTSQIADQALQSETQFLLDRYNSSLNQLNADIDRKYELYKQGALDTQSFLKDRWGQLQTSFENFATQSSMILSQFASQRADYETDVNAFLQPYNAMKDQLMTELGIDQAAYQAFSDYYDAYIKPYLDQLALDVGGQGR